jgi:hypothetical protein
MPFVPPNHEANARRTQDSAQMTFIRPISAVDIAALKVTVESNFPGVAFIFSGSEFNYSVTVQGSKASFTKAINSLFPKGRSDITIQPGQTLP